YVRARARSHSDTNRAARARAPLPRIHRRPGAPDASVCRLGDHVCHDTSRPRRAHRNVRRSGDMYTGAAARSGRRPRRIACALAGCRKIAAPFARVRLAKEHAMEHDTLFERLWCGAAALEEWTAAVSGGVARSVTDSVAALHTGYLFGNATAIRTDAG